MTKNPLLSRPLLATALLLAMSLLLLSRTFPLGGAWLAAATCAWLAAFRVADPPTDWAWALSTTGLALAAFGRRKARVNVERNVGEADDEARMAQPPQRGRHGKRLVDVANQIRAGLYGLQHCSTILRLCA